MVITSDYLDLTEFNQVSLDVLKANFGIKGPTDLNVSSFFDFLFCVKHARLVQTYHICKSFPTNRCVRSTSKTQVGSCLFLQVTLGISERSMWPDNCYLWWGFFFLFCVQESIVIPTLKACFDHWSYSFPVKPEAL